MSEFSCSHAKNGGFRFSMAERLSRLFDAQKTRATAEGETRFELSGPLRVQLRCEWRPVGVRNVSAKTKLQGVVDKSKRAASAQVFQRVAERLTRLEPKRASSSVNSAFVESASVACELVPIALRQVALSSRQSRVGVRCH